jgi:phasin family protein
MTEKTEIQAPKAEAPKAPVAEAATPAVKTAEAPRAPATEAAKAAPVVAKAATEAATAPAKAVAAAKPAKARRAKAATAARKAAKPARAKARKPRAAKRAVRKAAAVRKTAARTVSKTVSNVQTNSKEGIKIMKNEANKVADRIQAVFGDANERAKTAIERNTRIAEEMTDLAKGNVEALVASTKVAAKGVEKIGQEVAEYSRKSFEDASAAIKGFAEVKSPADLFRLQGEFARTQFDSMIAESSKLSETMIKLTGDVFAPITSRYSVAAERVKNAVAL